MGYGSSQGGQGGFSPSRDYSGGFYGDESRFSQGGMQRSRHHDDPDYQQWRDEQMRNLDRDYESWRGERYRKFSDDFSNWRSNRSQQDNDSGNVTASGQSSTVQGQHSGSGSQGTSGSSASSNHGTSSSTNTSGSASAKSGGKELGK